MPQNGNKPNFDFMEMGKRFAKAIKSQPIIWDKRYPGHKDKEKINDSYKLILKYMQGYFSNEALAYHEFDTSENLHKKFLQQRGVFSLRNRQYRTGKVDPKKKIWYLYKDFQFLEPHLRQQKQGLENAPKEFELPEGVEEPIIIKRKKKKPNDTSILSPVKEEKMDINTEESLLKTEEHSYNDINNNDFINLEKIIDSEIGEGNSMETEEDWKKMAKRFAKAMKNQPILWNKRYTGHRDKDKIHEAYSLVLRYLEKHFTKEALHYHEFDTVDNLKMKFYSAKSIFSTNHSKIKLGKHDPQKKIWYLYEDYLFLEPHIMFSKKHKERLRNDASEIRSSGEAALKLENIKSDENVMDSSSPLRESELDTHKEQLKSEQEFTENVKNETPLEDFNTLQEENLEIANNKTEEDLQQKEENPSDEILQNNKGDWESSGDDNEEPKSSPIKNGKRNLEQEIEKKSKSDEDEEGKTNKEEIGNVPFNSTNDSMEMGKKFAKAIKSQPIIWNNRFPGHLNEEKVNEAFTQVLQYLEKCFTKEALTYYEFNNVDNLKMKLGSAKSTFLRYHRQIKSDKLDRKKKIWYLYEDYLFLESRNLLSKKNKEGKKNSSPETIPSEENEVPMKQGNLEIVDQKIQEMKAKQNSNNLKHNPDSESSSDIENEEPKSSPIKTGKRKLEQEVEKPVKTAASEEGKCLKIEIKQEASSTKNEDPFTNLVRHYFSMVKNPSKKLKIQGEILEVFQKYVQ